MPTDITTTPGRKPGKSSETKSKESKSGNQRKTQIIMEFLCECTPYEADALRAIIGIASGKTTVETMPQYDRAPHNHYLNFGWDKETWNADEIRIHRQTRTLELITSASQYVGKEEVIKITSALLVISSDRKDIDNMVSNLPKIQQPNRPSNNVNQSGNQWMPK